MRKSTKNASLHEALRNLWKIRIMLEKNYTETCATWMARRIESLIDHMQYGHALIAYHKQDGHSGWRKPPYCPTRQTSEEIMTSQE